MNSCPYCAQTNTRKDEYGYCKKYSCFYVSNTKDKYENLKEKLSDTIFLPTYHVNVFDGQTRSNPRKEQRSYLYKQIQNLLGFLPLECIK